MKIRDIFGGGQGPHKNPESFDASQSPWILGAFHMVGHDPEGGGCHHDHAPGDACSEDELQEQEVSFCIRISNSGQPEFLSVSMVRPGEIPEPGLMTALRAALFEPMVPNAPRPPCVLVASDTDKQRLEMAGGTYGLAVLVDPNVAELVDEMGNLFVQMQNEGGLNLPSIAPVPDGESIDEPFVRSYLDAALEFWKATPWNDMNTADLFRVTLPDGAERYVCLMGQGGQEFGALLFKSEQDFAAFNIASVGGMLHEMMDSLDDDDPNDVMKEMNQLIGSLPDGMDQMVQNMIQNPPPMPEIIGLNFNPPDEAPIGMDAYLEALGTGWLKQDVWPMTLKYEASESSDTESPVEFCEITVEEFAIVRDTALALARACTAERKKSNWPPQPGFSTSIALSEKSGAPVVKLDFIGDIEE